MALSFTQHLMSKDDLKKKSTGNKLTTWDELSEYFRKQLKDDDKRPLLSIEDRTDENDTRLVKKNVRYMKSVKTNTDGEYELGARFTFGNAVVPLGIKPNGKFGYQVPCNSVEQGKKQLIEFVEQGIEQKDRDTLSMLAKWFMNDITGKKQKLDRDTIPEDLLGGA